MRLADLPAGQAGALLRGPGLRLRVGSLVTSIRSPLDAVRDGVLLHYGQHPVEADDGFADFHVCVDRPAGVRRWLQPQVVFRFDGDEPFAPLPGNQGYPLLEWGMNWCVYTYCHQFLTLHSAVVEKGGRALILPAPSGSGKSTLCAALAFGGWRLLSDELALIDPASGLLSPLPRPISLKNQSIDVIRAYASGAAFSPAVADTVKGSVAHVRPPADAVAQADRRALPRWVVLPRFLPGAQARLEPLPRSRAFMTLIDNAFNYNVHGRAGFATLAALVEGCDCYEFTYGGSLDEALAIFDRLAAETPG